MNLNAVEDRSGGSVPSSFSGQTGCQTYKHAKGPESGSVGSNDIQNILDLCCPITEPEFSGIVQQPILRHEVIEECSTLILFRHRLRKTVTQAGAQRIACEQHRLGTLPELNESWNFVSSIRGQSSDTIK